MSLGKKLKVVENEKLVKIAGYSLFKMTPKVIQYVKNENLTPLFFPGCLGGNVSIVSAENSK